MSDVKIVRRLGRSRVLRKTLALDERYSPFRTVMGRAVSYGRCAACDHGGPRSGRF